MRTDRHLTCSRYAAQTSWIVLYLLIKSNASQSYSIRTRLFSATCFTNTFSRSERRSGSQSDHHARLRWSHPKYWDRCGTNKLVYFFVTIQFIFRSSFVVLEGPCTDKLPPKMPWYSNSFELACLVQILLLFYIYHNQLAVTSRY